MDSNPQTFSWQPFTLETLPPFNRPFILRDTAPFIAGNHRIKEVYFTRSAMGKPILCLFDGSFDCHVEIEHLSTDFPTEYITWMALPIDKNFKIDLRKEANMRVTCTDPSVGQDWKLVKVGGNYLVEVPK